MIDDPLGMPAPTPAYFESPVTRSPQATNTLLDAQAQLQRMRSESRLGMLESGPFARRRGVPEPSVPGIPDMPGPPQPQSKGPSAEDLLIAKIKKDIEAGAVAPSAGVNRGPGSFMPSGSTQQTVAQELPARIADAQRLGLL